MTSRRYKSWDGCDITAIVKGEVLEPPRKISYRVTRDTAVTDTLSQLMLDSSLENEDEE